MPLKKKKATEEEEVMEQDHEASGSNNDSSDDDDGPEAYSGNEEIQVDFEGRNPIDTDFHGIRLLLQQLFLKAQINLSELSDVIIGQNYIGSVVMQCNDDDDPADDDDDDMDDLVTVFGITTAINITKKSEIGCIQELRNHILQRSEKHATPAALKIVRDVLTDDAKPVGFLLNERFVNIPPQISVPLLESLLKEVRRATAKGMPYQFTYYLMFVKFYRKMDKKNKVSEDLYTNAEEEVVCEGAVASFEYSVQGETESAAGGDWDNDSGLIPYRKIVLFDANKLPSMISSIKQLMEG